MCLTSEMPHLRIFPRSRFCQNLTRGNSLQVLSYMLSVCAFTAMRGGCWTLRCSLSESRRGARQKTAAVRKSNVACQLTPEQCAGHVDESGVNANSSDGAGGSSTSPRSHGRFVGRTERHCTL